MAISTETWDRLLDPWAAQLANTPQDPCWHGEGDVLTHTKMVCEELKSSAVFQNATDTVQEILYLAALLHDIGKISATRPEDGHIVSPGHARTGAAMEQ